MRIWQNYMATSKFKTFNQKVRQVRQRHLSRLNKPIHVEWCNDAPNIIYFDGGLKAVGSCVRCYHCPCMKLSEEEIKEHHFVKFPQDVNTDLCPTGAITWPYDSESPVINEELCIGCGLCAFRCPAYAIFLKNNSTVAINDEANDVFVTNGSKEDGLKTKADIAKLVTINWSNPLVTETDAGIKQIYKRIYENAICVVGNNPNLFIRNLLILLGVPAAIRRTGDVNIRMDIVFGGKGCNVDGVGEIEFGPDILSTPRNILDNIAVFVSRYKLKSILPIVFPLTLPNQRSEYWQVIKDINQVLKLPVRTITLGMLLVLLWNKKRLSTEMLAKFYSDADSFSGRVALEAAIGRKLNVASGVCGIIEPQK